MLPIPGSDYTMRLWPGSSLRSEHCLDFIETKTGKPINVPEKYSIWLLPTPEAPWLQGTGPVELVTLERSFGLQPTEIGEGEERYILRDGMTCMLSSSDGPEAIFDVPLRRQLHMPYRHLKVLTPTQGH